MVGIEGDRIWVRQQFVDGDVYEKSDELQKDLEEAGWEKIGPMRYRDRKSGAIIRDAKPSNVIRGKDGRLWPFDVVVEDVGDN